MATKEFFKRSGITTTEVEYVKGSPANYNAVLRNYHELLDKKILDRQLFLDVGKHRDKILRHRISCDVTLRAGETEAKLKVFHILIEEGAHIATFWIDKIIDPSGFPALVKQFEYEMQSYGAKSVTIEQHPHKTGTVKTVRTVFTFA